MKERIETLFRLAVFSLSTFAVSFSVLTAKVRSDYQSRIADLGPGLCVVLFVTLILGSVVMMVTQCRAIFTKYRIAILGLFVFDLIINTLAESLISVIAALLVFLIWIVGCFVLVFFMAYKIPPQNQNIDSRLLCFVVLVINLLCFVGLCNPPDSSTFSCD